MKKLHCEKVLSCGMLKGPSNISWSFINWAQNVIVGPLIISEYNQTYHTTFLLLRLRPTLCYYEFTKGEYRKDTKHLYHAFINQL